MLRLGVPFAFSRWGDGEWAAILGRSGTNCDGHPYSGALNRALSAVLERPPTYLVALQAFAMRQDGAAITAWLARRALRLPWVDADVFAQASLSGTLTPLIEVLRARGIVLVGPDHLEGLRLFPMLGVVRVPSTNSFAAFARLQRDLLELLPHVPPQAVVAVSAGMTANLLVDAVHQADAGRTVIDFGSLWDPYVGRRSRKYHRAVLQRLRACV